MTLKKPNLPSRDDIKNRLRDAMGGLGEGADMNPPGTVPEPEVYVPELRELGIPAPVLKQLRADIAAHIDMGYVVDEETNQYVSRDSKRKKLGDKIKVVLANYAAADEMPRLISESFRVSRYSSSRSSFAKDKARDELLKLGVPADKIKKAWDAATTVNSIFSMRISPPGVADEE